MKLNKVIQLPIITEKSVRDTEEHNRYHFRVSKSSSKGSIANAVASLFDVEVIDVKTIIVPGKPKRILKSRSRQKTKTKSWKKAIVQVKEGQKIKLVSEAK